MFGIFIFSLVRDMSLASMIPHNHSEVEDSCPCADCDENLLISDEDDEALLNHDLSFLLKNHQRTSCSRGRSYVNCLPSDSVFRSHILMNIFDRDLMLPKNVMIFKKKARDKFGRYKKAECERRRRYAGRRKMIFTNKFIKQTRESRRLQKQIDREVMNGIESSEKLERLMLKKAKVLDEARYDVMLNEAVQDLTMRCEKCKKLYMRVNLFWGISLCDVCYFDKRIIYEIMDDYEKFCKPKKSRFNFEKIKRKVAVDENADDDDDDDDNEDDDDDEKEFMVESKFECERILHGLNLVKNRVKLLNSCEEEEEQEEEETFSIPFLDENEDEWCSSSSSSSKEKNVDENVGNFESEEKEFSFLFDDDDEDSIEYSQMTMDEFIENYL